MNGLSCPDYVVTCAEVKSGDTLVVEDQVGTRKTVRLWGIDAPEADQPHGPTATEAARGAAKGKRVEVEVTGEDGSGRLIGRVRAGRTRLGPLLIRGGHAWHDRRQAPEATDLAALEREARQNGRGLWAQENPVPPGSIGGAAPPACAAPSGSWWSASPLSRPVAGAGTGRPSVPNEGSTD